MEAALARSADMHLDSALVARKVLTGRINVFAERAFAGALTAPLGMLLLAWVGASAVGWIPATVWFCVFSVVEFHLARSANRYRRPQAANVDVSAQARHLILLNFAVGLGWGSSVWIFGVDGRFESYLMNLSILVGVAGISVMVMSPSRAASVLFFGGLLLSPLVHATLNANPFSAEIAVGMAVFFGLLLQYSQIAGKQLISDLESTARNEMLAERLQLALGAAHQDWFDLNLQTGAMLGSAHAAKPLEMGIDADHFRSNLQSWLDTVHAEDRLALQATFQNLSRPHSAMDVEYRMQTRDLRWLWIRSAGRVVEWNEADQPVRLIGIHTDITQRKSADEQINQLAFYDHLTALPNRRLLNSRLEQAIANANAIQHQRCGALMLMDMDDFKALNDTLGHDIGDKFLIEVANRLKSCVRAVDTVARQGGDEFVVILEDLAPGSAAHAATTSIAENILTVITQPYLLDLNFAGSQPRTYSYHCTASIGIAFFDHRPSSADELMKRADTAMYQAKAMGRNTFRFFDPDMQSAVTARAALDNDLRDAVRENQFLLYFQPQVDGAGRMTGAEALIRWRHPTRGLVLPSEFIPVAEATGMIHPIGYWVLETACAQLVEWATRPETAHLTLSVNVSAAQFQNPGFMDHILATLESTQAVQHKLKLEITESLLLNNAEAVIAKMSVLKTKGISFSMDDFGTGYSSLSYLKRLPLDQLKIDKSFIQDVLTNANDAVIARAIVGLAQSMGVAVIAEGVEADAQRAFLAANGCHAYQGYFFGRPVPIDEFEDLFEAVNPIDAIEAPA